jgi:hypothetical protein
MSDASLDHKLGPPRSLRSDEIEIITKLVRNTPFQEKILAAIGGTLVRDMPDGGMGSVKFRQKTAGEPIFGKQIAEGAFRDADGVPVSITLNLDKSGDLFELDVFKADGSPVVRYPDLADLEIIERHGNLGFPP